MLELLIGTLLTLLATAATLFLVFFCRAFVLSPLRHIPTDTWYDPIFGSTSYFTVHDGRLFDTMDKARSTNGRIRRNFLAFGESRLFVCDVVSVKHILSTNSRAYCRGKHAGGDMFRLLMGDHSLIVTSGELHHRLRRIATPAFKPAVLRSLLPIVTSCTSRLIDRLSIDCARYKERTTEIAVKEALSDLTLDVIGLAAFGYDFQLTHNASTPGEFAEAFRVNFDSTVPLISVLPGYGRVGRLLQRAAPFIELFCQSRVVHILDWIRRFRAKIPRLLRECKGDSATNLLRCIQKGNADGRLDQEEIKDMVMTFILAGHETSAVALSWTLLLLAENAEWQRRCRDEIRSIEELSWDAVHRLGIVRACVFEAMRLFPPVPAVNRMTVEEDTIGGYAIPAGTDVLIGIAELHRDPDVWEHPHEFRPERFFDEELVPADAFLPFGAGVHKCIGYQLAIGEMLVILASLLAKFEFSNSTGVKYREMCGITLLPKPDLKLTLRALESETPVSSS